MVGLVRELLVADPVLSKLSSGRGDILGGNGCYSGTKRIKLGVLDPCENKNHN